MLHRLRYSLKLLARSRSWRFTLNTMKQRQASSLATFISNAIGERKCASVAALAAASAESLELVP